jgi:hypothetical protein
MKLEDWNIIEILAMQLFLTNDDLVLGNFGGKKFYKEIEHYVRSSKIL